MHGLMDLEAEHGGAPGQLRLAVYPRYSIVSDFNDLNPRLDSFWEKDVPFPRAGLEVAIAWPQLPPRISQKPESVSIQKHAV